MDCRLGRKINQFPHPKGFAYSSNPRRGQNMKGSRRLYFPRVWLRSTAFATATIILCLPFKPVGEPRSACDRSHSPAQRTERSCGQQAIKTSSDRTPVGPPRHGVRRRGRRRQRQRWGSHNGTTTAARSTGQYRKMAIPDCGYGSRVRLHSQCLTCSAMPHRVRAGWIVVSDAKSINSRIRKALQIHPTHAGG